MALISPGVQVNIVDESFYASAGPGTVPLIIIATEQDKIRSDGTGVALGTTKATSEGLWLVTSQRDLLQTFGTPNFYNVSGNSLHGYPLNEYGLLAAHSYLATSDRAYVLRADIDLAQLQPRTEQPYINPSDGTYWLSLGASRFGVKKYNSTTNKWEPLEQVNVSLDYYLDPLNSYIAIVDDPSFVDETNDNKPKNLDSFEYAIVPKSFDTSSGHHENKVYKRTGATWDVATFTYASHTDFPTAPADGDIIVQTTSANLGSWYDLQRFNSVSGNFEPVMIALRSSYDTLSPERDDVAYDYVDGSGNAVEFFVHTGKSYVQSVGVKAEPTISVATGTLTFTVGGVQMPSVTLAQDDAGQGLLDKINAVTSAEIVASYNSFDMLVLTSINGKDFEVRGSSAEILSDIGFNEKYLVLDNAYGYYSFSNWERLGYTASVESPKGGIPDGTLWYDSDITILDLLVNELDVDLNEKVWKTFEDNIFHAPVDPVVEGFDEITAGDIWIDTSDLDNYPQLYRRNSGNTGWDMIDTTDQTTSEGIIFGDVRVNPTADIDEDDPSYPQPYNYPTGMLLWNTRYSAGNVKRYTKDHIMSDTENPDRWVSVSGNRHDGSPYMLNNAVRQVIIEAMASVIKNNEEIKADSVIYNIIAAPGYVELTDELVDLNIQRKETGFVITEAPFRLKPNSQSLSDWASNANGSPSNDDNGLVTQNAYVGVYYPGAAMTTNLDGEEVVVPTTHSVLRVLSYNDSISYPWFAPAGSTRGLISNATSVGYLNDEDEFRVVELNTGQKDTLYLNNVNPIALIVNQGLYVYGQKTRNPVDSALDRINVARLVNYIKFRSDQMAQQFLFEPNDATTRNNAKRTYDAFLGELVLLRGLYDYITVCDNSNNTPSRIDRNELWIDIAIQPTKIVEFIYIPIRIRNTGESLS